MCASTEKVYKRRRNLNRKDRIKAFMKGALILAATFSLLIYAFTTPKKPKIKYARNWSKIGISIVTNDNTTNQKYYDGVQLIVPKHLRGHTDWHDYEAMKADAKRLGPGEQGNRVHSKMTYTNRGQNLLKEYGLDATVSDIISVNRSVPDTRQLHCREKFYLSQLPTVSVIIVCQHDYPSVLKRALHSIVNRSPGMLLMELIIVHTLNERNFRIHLERYARLNFPQLIKFVYLNRPSSLIAAKIEGAKMATASVIIFLGPHFECNYNWLPPLLEPIALNRHIITFPIIDTISPETFAYKAENEAHRRVGFDWDLDYEHLPLLLPEGADRSAPFKNIILPHKYFAIERNYFWELNGFDENYSNEVDALFDFSFKTWMCGGQILTVPCSHIGEIDLEYETNLERREESKKRLAESWLDDYKKFVYASVPELYATIDAGDLSEQRELRQHLKCQTFNWFLQHIAPDILDFNPPMAKSDLAWGFLRLALYPELCLDSAIYEDTKLPGLNLCDEDQQQQDFHQNWRFSWRGNLQLMHKNLCLEAFLPPPNATVYVVHCHFRGEGQTWRYDRQRKFFLHKKSDNICLDVIDVGSYWRLVLNECDVENVGMHWTFDYVNETALNEYDEMLASEQQWGAIGKTTIKNDGQV